MKTKKIVSLVLASMLVVSSFTACAKGKSGSGIVDMTMFAAMAGKEKDEGNEIKELIAQKTGVRVKESWLTGQNAGEAIGSIIASGKLPDFIDGGDGSIQLYQNKLLVAWDPYLEKYPNLKEMYTDEEWDKFRQEDGKIYWANVFGNHYKDDTTTGHNGEAFWIRLVYSKLLAILRSRLSISISRSSRSMQKRILHFLTEQRLSLIHASAKTGSITALRTLLCSSMVIRTMDALSLTLTKAQISRR